jgi:3-methylornithine--L-lysine ligase
MKILIVGGSLQGVEVTYLARHAGWETILIDKHPDVAAAQMAHRFIELDVTDLSAFQACLEEIAGIDLVVPATENAAALAALQQWSQTATIPLAFDAAAYAISSSKLRSDSLFARLNVPAPRPWPDCSFPVIAKPDSSSGSRGVRFFKNRSQLEEFFYSFSTILPPPGWVIQEYVEGPSYSLEVMGNPGNYIPLVVTDLDMDESYDCKRVLAPIQLSSTQVKEFEKISLHIAEAIQLHGIMDVEVILHHNQLKVLEIDARFPSQPPTAVFRASGCNMIPLLAQCFTGYKISKPQSLKRGAIYQHIEVSPRGIRVSGEHIMPEVGPLHLCRDFFGADEAITNYIAGATSWVATLIIEAADLQTAKEKCSQIMQHISQKSIK